MKKILFLSTLLVSALSLEILSSEKIPVQHFFCDSAMTSGTLSPDGKYFAAMVPASGAKCAIEENDCLLYTSPSPRDATLSRMPSSA